MPWWVYVVIIVGILAIAGALSAALKETYIIIIIWLIAFPIMLVIWIVKQVRRKNDSKAKEKTRGKKATGKAGAEKRGKYTASRGKTRR